MAFCCGACGQEHEGRYRHCGGCGAEVEKKSRGTVFEWGLIVFVVYLVASTAMGMLSSVNETETTVQADSRTPSVSPTQNRNYSSSPQPRYETFTIRCTFNCKESGNFPGTQTQTWTGGATYTVQDTEYWNCLLYTSPSPRDRG